MYYGKVERGTDSELKPRQLKAMRANADFFSSLRRMALKPLPVLAAIRGKPPLENY